MDRKIQKFEKRIRLFEHKKLLIILLIIIIFNTFLFQFFNFFDSKHSEQFTFQFFYFFLLAFEIFTIANLSAKSLKIKLDYLINLEKDFNENRNILYKEKGKYFIINNKNWKMWQGVFINLEQKKKIKVEDCFKINE